jgi:DNA-binding transcriptional MerR regulator
VIGVERTTHTESPDQGPDPGAGPSPAPGPAPSLLGIGETARSSGLTVSALRFYDGAGVLVPAEVDRHTGYRWYAPAQLAEARLLARLRRVGMPLADIRRVLAARAAGPGEARAEAHALLDAHLTRLEDGLAAARRELSAVRSQLDLEDTPMAPTDRPGTVLTLPAARLAAAFDAVRFAVGTDPELPMLSAVLIDLDADGLLRTAATDRYRLAVGRAGGGRIHGPAASALLPAPFADTVRALLGPTAGEKAREEAADEPREEAELRISPDRVTVTVGPRSASGQPLDLDFPDYRRLLRHEPRHRVPVTTADLAAALTPDLPDLPEVCVLVLDGTGALTVAGSPGDARVADAELAIGVNREYLLQALAAAGREQLTLELGGPVAPLALRAAEGAAEGTPGDAAGDAAEPLSLLMPVSLD